MAASERKNCRKYGGLERSAAGERMGRRYYYNEKGTTGFDALVEKEAQKKGCLCKNLLDRQPYIIV